MRAVSVEVTESSGVAGLLLPGCRVDVIATLRQDNMQIAKTIVENAKVQAVGVKMSRNKNESRGEPSKTVTLIVTSKDAEAIELASNSGKPRLVLRGMADTDRSHSSGVTFAELSGQAVPAAEVMPANADAEGSGGWGQFFSSLAAARADGATGMPPQPVRWPVQIIRGNDESTIFYEVSPRSVESKSGSSPSKDDSAASK
jgi:pilus assembly protein CpaB